MDKRRLAAVLVWATILTLATNAVAAERQGWYAGMDLGVAIPETLNSRSRDSDVVSNCDQWLTRNGERFEITNGENTWTVPFALDECRERGVEWTNGFDLDNGILAGLNLGYAWRSVRFEIEYLHREHSGDKAGGGQSASALDYKTVEFVESSEILSDLRADSFFGNLYYDFHGLFPRVIPYVGAGAGLTNTRLEISGKYLRNPNQAAFTDPEGIGATAQGGPKNPELAGTDTLYDDAFSGTVFAYQFMAGFDYALTDRLFLGVKARYGAVGTDLSARNPYDLLRSHASTICPPDGPEGCPTSADNDVHYWFETDDLSFWGISLNLKYFFQ